MNETTGPFPRERIKQLFVEILELPPDQRAAFIATHSAGDAELRDELESLLLADVRAGEFLGEPTAGGAAVAIAERTGQAPRQQIGPYRLLQVIGEGGFGTVYLAEQQHPVRRRVALKLIKLGMDTHEIIARFDAERQALALMDHPGIARVFDAGATENGRPYFVMELVRGVPITEYCDRQKLDIAKRLRLFADVCGAVQHAHTKGIIHRDLKPSNILVSTQDDRPAPKIIDFGIAKATQSRLTDKTLFTEYHQFIGSPQYMSPEQSEGSLDIDTRSDVYSLGAMLYELLTGTTPIDAQELKSKTHAQIQQAIREVEPPKPSTRLSSMKQTLTDVAERRAVAPSGLGMLVRGELDWIVMKAMEKDRSRRYETSAAIAADVEHYLNDEPVSAARPSRAYLARKFVRRNRRIVAASAAVLVTLLAGVIGTSVALVKLARERTTSERERAIAEAVSKFQTDMLSFAEPAKGGDKVTVLEAMKAAISELDAGRLKDQPLVEAGVRCTIGLTLRSLGRPDTAEPNLRLAYTIRRDLLPTDDSALVQTKTDLGLTVRELGKHDEADRLFRQVLESRRRTLPADHPDVASSMNNVALIMHDRGQFDQAMELYRDAVAIQRKAYGDKDDRVAQSISNLGGILYTRGEPKKAEAYVREALAIRRTTLPPRHPFLASSINNLSAVLLEQGKLEEAEKLSREALAIQREVLPPDHVELGATLNNFGALLNAMGKREEALPLYRESLAIRRKSLPETHADISTTLINLGVLLSEMGENAEAEQSYRDALELQRRGLPADHPDIAWTYNMLSVLLQAQGRLAEAEPLARESLRMRRASLPPGHADTAASANNLASLLRAQEKFAEAEPLYREALAGFLNKLPPDHWQVGQVRSNIGKTLSAMSRFAEAEPELIHGERLLANSSGTPPGRHALAIEALATLYDRWNNVEPTEQRAAEAKRWKARLAATRPTTNP